MSEDYPYRPPRILMQDGKWDPSVPRAVRKQLLARPEPVATDKGISFAKLSLEDHRRRQERNQGGRFK